MSAAWVDISSKDDVPEDDVVGIDINVKSIALYQVDGEIYATDNICTHGNARLCDGFLEGYEIECPLHQGKFDIRNGKALCAPLADDVRIYPVKIENGRVFVEI